MGTKGHSFILVCNPSSAALKASEAFHETPTASFFFFFSLLKSNLYNPISGPYATAHLGSSRRVTAVSLQPPRAPRCWCRGRVRRARDDVWRQMELYPAGISSSSPCRAGRPWIYARPRRPAWGWMLAAAPKRAFAGDRITHTSSSLRGFGLEFLPKTHDF